MDEAMAADVVDVGRRKFLVGATSATGTVGAVIALVPFVQSWLPSESARAAGAPARLDLTKIEPGQMATVTWRKQQIYVVRRTEAILASLPKHDAKLKDPESAESDQPVYAKNAQRAVRSVASTSSSRRCVNSVACTVRVMADSLSCARRSTSKDVATMAPASGTATARNPAASSARNERGSILSN